MQLFVARHGQTEWDFQGRIIGRTDIPLTEAGHAQAEILAEKAREAGIELIIVSPMLRARQTAEHVAKACGAPVIVDARLTEQDYGIYEGRPGKDPDFQANKRMFAYRYPGGESMMQLAGRVYPLLNEIKQKHQDKKVLLVTHGGICRVIRSYFVDMTNEEYARYVTENAAIMEYTF